MTAHVYVCLAMNTFAFLSSGNDPDQVVSNAATAAKNRRKKEKRKQQKAADEAAARAAQPVDATPAAGAQAAGQRPARTLTQLTSELMKDAGSTDTWRTWDKWYREVRALWSMKHSSRKLQSSSSADALLPSSLHEHSDDLLLVHRADHGT